ncbi:hypothetical protein P0W64_10215 [Tsukamurella sp. 8F]|uniref:hypothetical protein n=1 Tax=unclassified Tsukamurella TaxID=2633480 RepID=UPI0023B9D7C2|nr:MULTISPECIES: hypothetical protein [unclassified Tsukamurella]MDF0529348.1 hypothetical protein [Tsukamurella sp. 8J]MDF0587145.1 hypothetical protein [Tsukamurella sp. 8F]
MRAFGIPLPQPWRSTVAFGEPHVTPDGTTIITVSRVRGRPDADAAGTVTTAIGVYTIRDGAVAWTPAVDVDRIASIGIATGFVAALLGTAAVVRRPPWPALTGTITVVRNR